MLFLDNTTLTTANYNENTTETALNTSQVTIGMADNHRTIYSNGNNKTRSEIINKINDSSLDGFLTTSTKPSQLSSSSKEFELDNPLNIA